MREQLIRIGKVISSVVAVVGGAVALVTFFFGDLNEVLGRLAPYRTSIIGVTGLVALLAVYVWVFWMCGKALWMLGRATWRGIHGWLQKRRDRRQLRDFVKSIAALKQFVHRHYARHESHGKYLDIVMRRQDELTSKLAEIGIPYPVRPETPNYVWELERWAMYLDMLLPLAVVGDIDEARMILSRVEEPSET